jgi:hypothetical protein
MPPKELVGCVAIPLSNVEHNEYEKLQSMLRGVESILRDIHKETGVSIELRCPDFQKDMRHDRGSEIYLSTISRLQECDFALTFATPPATGVGIMMRLFANASLPCLSVAEEGSAVSRMFDGMYCRHIGETIRFSDAKDVPQLVKDAIVRNIGSLRESAGCRRPVRHAISQTSFRGLVNNAPTDLRAAYEKVLHEPPKVESIREEWMRAFAEKGEMLPNTTLVQFVHIASKLEWTIRVLPSGVPYLTPPIGLESVHDPVHAPGVGQPRPAESTQGCVMEGPVLFILRHAPCGLPTDVLCAVTQTSEEDLHRLLQPSLDLQVLNLQQGMWTLLKSPETDTSTATSRLIHRTIECLLNCCEFDRDTAFSRALLKNIPHLSAGADPIPEDLLIRARLADSDGADAHQRDQRKAAALAFVRKQISRREGLRPLEYAQALVVSA